VVEIFLSACAATTVLWTYMGDCYESS